MSVKGRVVRWLGSAWLREGVVRAVAAQGDFHRVEVDGPFDGLRPGDKVQAFVAEHQLRTWTPIPRAGGAALLVWRRPADTPGMRWIRTVAAGDRFAFVGPDRSLRVPDGPVTVVGDETSVAVAAAVSLRREARVVLELGPGVDAAPALASAGLGAATVLRRGGPAPDWVAAVGAAGPVLLTGGGELVQRVRAALRAGGRPPEALRTYWVEGRVGLD